MVPAVIRPLALLRGRKIRRDEGGLAIAPPPGPGGVEGLRALREGLLAALEAGEVVAGEELLANPYRLAALLLALFPVSPSGSNPPPEGPLEVATFRPGRVERLLAPHPLPVLRAHARTTPPPERLHLSPPGGRWLLEVEPPVQALLVARSAMGLEVLALPEEAMRRYLSAAARARLAPQEASLETPSGVFTDPAWAALEAALARPQEVAR